jgi:hypothetical protein
MILDLIAHNNWERPIYFTSIIHENINGLRDYFRLEGFAYRLVPIKHDGSGGLNASINSNILYEKYMNVFRWGNMNNPDVFVDFYTKRTTTILRLRYKFVHLANQLYQEGEIKRAEDVLDRITEIMPIEQFDHDIFLASIAEVYYRIGADEKANKLVNKYFDLIYDELEHMLSLQSKFGQSLSDHTNRMIGVIQEVMRITEAAGQDELTSSIEKRITDLASRY